MGLLAEIIHSFNSLSFGYVRIADRKCAQQYTMCVCVYFLLFEFVTTLIGVSSFNQKVFMIKFYVFCFFARIIFKNSIFKTFRSLL